MLSAHPASSLSDEAASAARVLATSGSVEFRRLRGKGSVQIALDCSDLSRAVQVARAAAAAGADFLEVGDPLIKRYGTSVISEIRAAGSRSWIVAEMMSADWGQDQVEEAAFRGADVVLLVGPASPASVERATAMARRLGVVLILEVRSHGASEAWCRAAQQAGVDGFAVTANIDVGMHGPYPLQFASRLRRWTELPIAVSGGFSESDFSEMDQAVCDIAIVGRSVVDAIDPEAAARRICSLRKRTEGSRSA